jgi:hypothetical protein
MMKETMIGALLRPLMEKGERKQAVIEFLACALSVAIILSMLVLID